MAAKKTQTKEEKAPVQDKKAAIETVISRIERECGKGSIMRLGENSAMNVSAVSTGSLSLDFALGVGGIPRGSTGIGVSVVANKVDGIRCALLHDLMTARLTREHNDTNMMALGAGVVGQMLALQIIDTWLETPFSGNERHQRRIDKVMALEK